MKRIIAICLTFVLLFGCVACTGKTPTTQPATQKPTTQAKEPTKVVVVKLDANGGTCELTEMTLLPTDRYGDLPQPQREGYVFQGWYTAPEAGEAIGAETQLVSENDHTLYAHWQLQTEFTVTLDPNGGRLSDYNRQVTVTVGENYGTLPQPLREGFTFLGWFTAPDAGEQILDTTQFLDARDLVLYAHWEYDALAYWTYVLHSRVQTIPQCRRVVVYLEKTSNYKTFLDSAFLSDAGAINPAERLENEVVTDAWIRSANPYIIIKLTADIYMGLVNKTAMQRRFSDLEIYIFPVTAVNGIEEAQLYYRLQLAKILYPEYFADVDLEAVAEELQINPRIYY